jgi:DNA-binding CsgD family transcriptional regulator
VNIAATLALLAVEGRLLTAEHPEHAEALAAAHEHGLCRRYRCAGPGARYGITARGRRYLARPWQLAPPHTPLALARIRRDTIAALVAAGEPLTAEVADALGITPRRVRQIRSDIHRAARRMSEE